MPGSCTSVYRMHFTDKNTLNVQLTIIYDILILVLFAKKHSHEISTIIPLDQRYSIHNSSDLGSIIGEKKINEPCKYSIIHQSLEMPRPTGLPCMDRPAPG